MKVENIVRKLACSPHEFIEIYQEGKALTDVPSITKSQEVCGDGERIIKFVSAAYAPENLLKIMGCHSKHLKEQQELRITEDGIKIHTFYLPDMVPDSFRVETFWNITKETMTTEESSDAGTSIVDISIHSESGSYSMDQLLETFVAKSVAASIIQYLDIVDSYFSKFRTKMKQLLDPRNFIPTNFRFGSGKSESEKNDSLEVVESEEEQTERLQAIIKELKQTKNHLFRESQHILQLEIEFSEKNIRAPHAPSTSRPSTPPPTRTLNQLTYELWKQRQTNTAPDHTSPSYPSSPSPSPSYTPPHPSYTSSHPPYTNSPHPDDLHLLEACEANLRSLQSQRTVTDLEVDCALTNLECRLAKPTIPKQESTLSHVYQCAKYLLPLSLLVLAVLHRRNIL